MATSGETTIRGIDIDKLAKGFADENIIFKRYCTVNSTSAREIRWYQKSSGFLSGTTTSGMTDELIENTDQLAKPTVVEQSWTRKTSYVKKFFVESPTISDEDIKDSDVDIIATNVRDLTRAVEKQVDERIWNVMTEEQSPTDINSFSTTSAWDGSGQDPIKDLMKAKRLIRENAYDPDGAVLFLSPQDHENLLSWLISDKGSSIPQFSSQKVENGEVMELLGLKVVVSDNVTSDYAAVVVPNRACTWKEFTPITSVKVEDKGIGTKIRVWEEGEALLTDPKAVTLITDTQA